MRLMVDPPLRGSLNMSIDRVLLQSAAESGVATLRIYRWQPATISLGYFQAYGSRSQHSFSADCPVVRRASGGGAIVHDQELTYSLALPESDPWAGRNRDLFARVHQTLIDCLHELGVAECKVYQDRTPETRSEPFLCFKRRANGDVVLGRDKIIGSAQRRLKKALLQHGSVLVERSPFAPELPGVVDLCPSSNCSVDNLIARWPLRLAGSMERELIPGKMTDAETGEAKSVESECFGSPSWTKKR